MSRFAPALRRAARELDLPAEVRASLLLEMAADLEAVYAHHRERGADEAEAVRRAEETVLASSEVLRRLGRLHARSWKRWSAGIGGRLTGGGDLLLLVVAVAPMLVLAATMAVPLVLDAPRSPLTWAVLAVGVGIVGLVASEALGLWHGSSGPALRRRLPRLLLLSAVAPALGLLAAALGLHGLASDMAAGALEAAARAASIERAGRGAALLALGLLLGIAGGLAWFVLMNRASIREVRELEALLAHGRFESDPSPDRGRRDGRVVSMVGRRRR